MMEYLEPRRGFRLATLAFVAILAACADAKDPLTAPDGRSDLTTQGSTIRGYQAPTLEVAPFGEGVRACAAWADPRLFESFPEADFFSFDFSLREAGETPGWVPAGTARGGSRGEEGCIDLADEAVEGALGATAAEGPWLRVTGISRTGQGRQTVVHQTDAAYLSGAPDRDPGDGDPGDGDPGDGDSGDGDPGDGDPGEPSGSAEATVGEDGGALRLASPVREDPIDFIIPPGALEEEVQITISLLADSAPAPDRFVLPGTSLRFSPTGLRFDPDAPAILSLPFDPLTLPDGAQAGDVGFYRLNEDGTQTLYPTEVDLAAGRMTVRVPGFSRGQGICIPPTLTWMGGGAADAPDDWHRMENWFPACAVPGPGTEVIVPAGRSVYPRTRTAVEVRSLTVESGASVALGAEGLGVGESLRVDGTMTSQGGLVVMDVSGSVSLRGNVPNLWVLGGTTRLAGNTRVTGDVLISGVTPTLEVGTHRLEIGGHLELVGSSPARLLMDSAAGRVVVEGNALFASEGDGDPPLRAGTLELRGNFDQGVYPGAFRTSGNHVTLFAGGAGIQTAHFDHPWAPNSGFRNLDIGDTQELMLLSDAQARTLSFRDEGVGARVSGGGVLGVETALLRGALGVSELRISGSLGWAGFPYTVATTRFVTGTLVGMDGAVGIPDAPYQDVIVDGAEAFLEESWVTVRGDFAVEAGSFRTGSGRILTVNGDFRTAGQGAVFMAGGEGIVVHGNAIFRGSSRSPFMTGGTFWVGGDFESSAGTYPSGTDHVTVLFGTRRQEIRAVDTGFGKLAITNAGEGAIFRSSPALPVLDLVGRTRIEAGRTVSVGDVVFRSTARIHYEAQASFNCTRAWAEEGVVFTSDWNVVGCNPPLESGAVNQPGKPELGNYTPPSRLEVTIHSPATESVFDEGEAITFEASATLGGAPVQATLTWFSSLDGEFGEGARVTTDALSPGVQLVTVVAEDSDGTFANASVILRIEEDTNRPVDLVASSLTVGRDFSCALDREGQAYCWGVNGRSQLGNGTQTPSNTPVAVAGDHRFTRIDAGYEHACALDEAGNAWCWGRSDGLGITHPDPRNAQDSPVPVAVEGGLTFVDISAGGAHTCALQADGRLFCWGRGTAGELGRGPRPISGANLPGEVVGGLRFTAFETHDLHTCAISTVGDLWCWGSSANGRLGFETEDAAVWSPELVQGGQEYKAVALGEAHTCAITVADQLLCFGRNDRGQLGSDAALGSTTGGTAVPTPVNWTELPESVTAGWMHTCGITRSGATFCWGEGTAKLGTGTGVLTNPVPAPVQGGLSFSAVFGGWRHTCGLASGSVYCWGRGNEGQLGTGENLSSSTPLPVAPIQPQEEGQG